MKKLRFNFDRIVGGFVLLPQINLDWMVFCNKKYYDIVFAWLFWYIRIGHTQNILDDWNKNG